MTARPCPECGGLVASTLNQCPHCGYHIGIADSSPKMERGENPYNSLAYVILAIILFWPLGLVSLYYHIKSDDKWAVGNRAVAELYGNNARRFAKYSIYAVILFLILGLFVPMTLICVL